MIYQVASLSRTWDQWLIVGYCFKLSKVHYEGMVPFAYHIVVDGSCDRAENPSAWDFIVVVEDAMGDYVMEGFATDFISSQQGADLACDAIDNICVEAVCILYAPA